MPNSRIGLCCPAKYLSIGVALVLALGLGQAATAQNNCLQDQFTAAGNSQTLGCTANDVRVAKAINTRTLAGATLSQCTPGKTYNFIADFLVQTSSQSTRSNIGLYFGIGDPTKQTQALSGQCSDNIIGPGNPVGSRYNCANQTAATPLCGSTHYDEFDPSPDNCGDSSSSDPTVCLSAPDPATGNSFEVACPAPPGGSTWTGTQIVTVEIDGFVCPNTPGANVTLPDCTSWQVPGKTIQCQASPPDYLYSATTPAIPGSPSKCNCSTVTLPIIVQTPGITVTKDCTTNKGSSNYLGNPSTTSCTLDDPGTSTSNNVTYTVNISNTSNFGDIKVDQICDSAYGTVYKDSGYTGASCNPVGNASGISNLNCSSALTDVSSSSTCTFEVFQAEKQTVSDIITVIFQGLSGGGTSSAFSNNDTAITVTSGEADTLATATKAPVSITNACETVTYTTTVTNTSTGADESESLTALTDNGVDLTKIASGILGTTCGVATGNHGLGNLSTVTVTTSNGGSLPASLTVNGGSYTCQFSTSSCNPIGTVVKTPGTCDTVNTQLCTAGSVGSSCKTNSDCDVTCQGIQAPDTVAATVIGDEGASDLVTVNPASATATMCVTGP